LLKKAAFPGVFLAFFSKVVRGADKYRAFTSS
jgi:hypothetical protein